MPEEPTVFIVDDDPSIRRTLPAMIQSAGFRVETFASAEAFLSSYDPDVPGCVVLDLRMPGMTGLELQEELRGRGWSIPILFFSGFGTVNVAVETMRAGAVTFLEKPVEPEQLITRLREAIRLDTTTRERQNQKDMADARLAQLSPREREVLDLVISGKTSGEIAGELGISEKTVHVHRNHIMKKLRVRRVAELVRLVVGEQVH